MFGQWASSQTVLSFSSCMIPFRRTKFCEPGALTFSHSGLGSRGPMNWTGASTGISSSKCSGAALGPVKCPRSCGLVRLDPRFAFHVARHAVVEFHRVTETVAHDH